MKPIHNHKAHKHYKTYLRQPAFAFVTHSYRQQQFYWIWKNPLNLLCSLHSRFGECIDNKKNDKPNNGERKKKWKFTQQRYTQRERKRFVFYVVKKKTKKNGKDMKWNLKLKQKKSEFCLLNME